MDHRYPREDAIRRLGPAIREVIDGERAADTGERIDAALARMQLDLHTHYLARKPDSTFLAVEAEADAFAFEMMAPAAAIASRMEKRRPEVHELHCLLVEEFGLPPRPALSYARSYIGQYGASPPTLIQRLGLASR